MLATLAAFIVASPPSYQDCYAQAIREGRPLIVFVGIPAMNSPAWVAHEVRSFPGIEGKGVILSRPRGTYLEWVETLDWWTDASGIERRIQAMPPLPRQVILHVAPPRPVFSTGGVSC